MRSEAADSFGEVKDVNGKAAMISRSDRATKKPRSSFDEHSAEAGQKLDGR